MNLIELVRKRSPWVYIISQGTCNGCELECLACFAPRYDIERLGAKLVRSPRHADIVLLTGCGTERAVEKARMVFEQVPEPKVAVAVGACAINGGIFKCRGPRIEAKVKVEGCPPSPDEIIAGLKRAIECLKR